MSKLTAKQKVFIGALRDALIERHESYGISHRLFNTTVLFSLEGVGIYFGEPEYEEAYESLLFHPDLRLQQPIEQSAPRPEAASTSLKPRAGFVYVLRNNSFPELLKIGYTTQERLDVRVRQLSSSTGVPTPFEVVHSIKTETPIELEAMIHERLDGFRVYPKEFFSCGLDVAIAACNQCHQDMKGEA